MLSLVPFLYNIHHFKEVFAGRHQLIIKLWHIILINGFVFSSQVSWSWKTSVLLPSLCYALFYVSLERRWKLEKALWEKRLFFLIILKKRGISNNVESRIWRCHAEKKLCVCSVIKIWKGNIISPFRDKSFLNSANIQKSDAIWSIAQPVGTMETWFSSLVIIFSVLFIKIQTCCTKHCIGFRLGSVMDSFRPLEFCRNHWRSRLTSNMWNSTTHEGNI